MSCEITVFKHAVRDEYIRGTVMYNVHIKTTEKMLRVNCKAIAEKHYILGICVLLAYILHNIVLLFIIIIFCCVLTLLLDFLKLLYRFMNWTL